MSLLRLLTTRVALAEPFRTVLAIAQIAIVLGLTIGGAILVSSVDSTQQSLVSIVNGGSNASISIEPTVKSLDTALAAIPGGLAPQPKIIDTEMPVLSASKVGAEYFMQRPWDRGTAANNYISLAGSLPISKYQVSISQGIADEYQVGLGGTLILALDENHPVRIVGIAKQRTDYAQQFVLAAPGTWESLTPSLDVAATLAPSIDIAVSADPADQNLLQQLDKIGSVSFSSELTASRPIFLRLPLEIGFPTLALIGVAVAGILIVRIRRMTADFAVLAAIGTPMWLIVAATLASNVLLVAGGAVCGALLATALVALLAGPARTLAAQDLDVHAPTTGLFVVIAVVVLASAAVVLLAFIHTVGQTLVQGGGGRPADAVVASRQLTSQVRRSVQISAVLVFIYLLVSGSSGTTGDVLEAGALVVALVSTAPDMFTALHGLARKMPLGLALAVRWAARERSRGVAVVALVLVSLLLPVALATSVASFNAVHARAYRSAVQPGQIAVSVASALPVQSITALEQVGGQVAVASSAAASAEGELVGMRDAVSSGQITVIAQPKDILSLWGYALSSQDVDALQNHKLVVFDGVGASGQPVVITHGDLVAATLPVEAASGHYVSGVAGALPGAVILRSALQQNHLSTANWSYVFPGSAGDYDAFAMTAAKLGIAPGSLTKFLPAPSKDPTPASLLMSMVAGLFGALALTALLMTHAIAEWRRNLFQLLDLGAGPRVLYSALMSTSVGPALLGGILGAAGGVSVGAIRAAHDHVELALPWELVGWTLFAVVIVQSFLGLMFGYQIRRQYDRKLRKAWRPRTADRELADNAL